ncbi:MAG: AtpZ/AtpI family protein [Planctomycetales bacterium]|nr:AtpZ/AtpI family protein [Planctomycetales bacterium]
MTDAPADGLQQTCQLNTPEPDDRSPVAVAYQWAWRIITISLEMVLPGLAGYWLDTQLGTRVLFMLVGFGLGMFAAIWQLLKISQQDG